MSDPSIDPSGSGPLLGSAYLAAPSTPRSLPNLTPTLCGDISAFRELLRNFRAVDDSIILRLNRAHALNKTRDAEHYARFNESECAAFWRQLVDTWRSREAALRFCSGVTEQRLDAARTAPHDRDDRSWRDRLDAEETRAASIRQDLQVEAIIRQRTIQAFLSRCKGFAPPPKDDELLTLPPRLAREIIR